MIYIIVNQSHEWEDSIDDRIDFVSTSLEKAEEVWEECYSNFGTMDDSKWCYSADLREYTDGYNIYGLKDSKFKVLKHVDNIEE